MGHKAKRAKKDSTATWAVTVLKHLRDPVLTVDNKGCIRSLNIAAETLLAAKEKDLVSRPLSDVITPKNNLISGKTSQTLSKKVFGAPLGDPIEEDVVVNINGRELTTKLRASAIKDHAGKITGSILQLWPSAVSNLVPRTSCNDGPQLLDVLNAIPMEIIYVDAEQRLRIANKHFEQQHDIEFSTDKGKTINEILGDELYSKIREHVITALSGQSVTYGVARHCKNGGMRNLSVTYIPDFISDTAVRGFFGITHDVTERAIAEDLNTRTGRILDSSSNEFYIFNADSLRFVQVNQGARQNLGYTMAELARMTPLDLKVEYNEQSFAALLEPLCKGEQEQITFDTTHKRKDGSFYPVEVRLQLFRQENPPVYVAIIQDISERRHAEKERDTLLADLTAKNAELENFVYTITHDLKSPLITISGFAGLMQKDIDGGKIEAMHDDLKEIRKAAAHMETLINDLLALSRIGRIVGESQPVDVHSLLVNDVLPLFKERIDDAGATVNVADALPRIKVDPVRFVILFENLIENALKYRQKDVTPVIEIGSVHAQDEVRLFVRDNGKGIPKSYQKRIFELFERADVTSEGTGVGLAIARRIVEVQGGRLWVESEPGRGSSFWITLPDSIML